VNITRFDLNLLTVFDALLAERSVTGAARRLGMSQPAVSHALGRLRAQVGEPLFDRTVHGMVPTKRASAMAAPVAAALTEFRRAILAVAAAEPSVRAVRIAANSYARCFVVPAIVRGLAHDAPNISIELSDPPGNGDSPADLFIDSARAHPALPSTPVLRDRLVCIAATSNRRVGRRLTRQAFVDLPHVVLPPGTDEWSAGIDEALLRLNAQRKTGLMVSDLLSTPWIVSQSDFVATVPRRVADRFASVLGLRVLQPPLALPDAVLRIAWHEQGGRDPIVTMIRERVLAGIHHRAGGFRA
jgi:DNA-binding transcriptional LysR family regulator